MNSKRRYTEEEVNRILEQATEVERSVGGSPVSAEGMTLAELQSIGREVGIAPESIAHAATAIDHLGRDRV